MIRKEKPKPIKKYKIGTITRPREPYIPPLVPGLRDGRNNTNAIGFTFDYSEVESDEYNRKLNGR